MKLDKSNIDKYIKGDTLYCHKNNITSIEDIPDHITTIDCDDNKLTSLPKLPSGLKYLNCSRNKLTQLPKLPDSLIWLDCCGNNLTSRPIHNKDKQWFTKHNQEVKLLNRSTIINKIYENR